MESALFFGLLVAAGYVLGIVGFFRANAAHTEIRALRRALDERMAAPAHAPASSITASSIPASSIPASSALAPTIPAPAQAPVQEFVAETPGPPREPPPSPFGEPRPAPLPAEPPPQPKAARPTRDLETLLAARWGVWLGSAALLLAGVFLIRYAVEQDMLGPGARCALAGLLGAGLLAAAEWLFRRPAPDTAHGAGIDQAPAGLAAGGTAILFGAAYGAGPFYDLLPPLLAFLAMAMASFVGMAAALRYGPLTAATGIAGAFISPALVSSQNPSWPGLFAYLFVVSATALWVVRHTAWTWLAWATTLAGALWVVLAGAAGGTDLWAVAAFVPAAAALNLFLMPAAALDHPVGRRLAWVPFAALGIACLILEQQVPGLAPRLALFALSPLAVWRGATEERLDRLPRIAAAFGLFTLWIWDLPGWAATGETVALESGTVTVVAGAWAPAAIVPLLTAATLFAAFHGAAGLWFERRAPRPLHWSALTGAVPVLVLLTMYTRIAGFQTGFAWAAAALALAAGLTMAAAKASTEAMPRQILPDAAPRVSIDAVVPFPAHDLVTRNAQPAQNLPSKRRNHAQIFGNDEAMKERGVGIGAGQRSVPVV